MPLLDAEQSPDSVIFKHLSEWTVRTILAQFCPKRRAFVVSHFIKITAILHQMRNVHSEVAIFSSLFNAPIRKAQRHLVSYPQQPNAELFALCGSCYAVPTRWTRTA
ncbi:hypothetical protein TNIN_106771 [Trichonephila inaurata madagascariensis]|uniref:Ras-GEF domain-containing protein n=1 Tax=Trichonephila inaurata madagascariensis TaxID=2747483 RepID=A0A8X6YVF0_9ARAC|nr:hypothetical protein TNIN_106771 [Trichonephila inaurata madagascariensis]